MCTYVYMNTYRQTNAPKLNQHRRDTRGAAAHDVADDGTKCQRIRISRASSLAVQTALPGAEIAGMCIDVNLFLHIYVCIYIHRISRASSLAV